jgi:hypothetical protein
MYKIVKNVTFDYATFVKIVKFIELKHLKSIS